MASTARDIMQTQLVTLSPDDQIDSARRVFVATGRDDIDMSVARAAREEARRVASPLTQACSIPVL